MRLISMQSWGRGIVSRHLCHQGRQKREPHLTYRILSPGYPYALSSRYVILFLYAILHASARKACQPWLLTIGNAVMLCPMLTQHMMPPPTPSSSALIPTPPSVFLLFSFLFLLFSSLSRSSNSFLTSNLFPKSTTFPIPSFSSLFL